MNVIMLSDLTRGGAAISCKRLRNGLSRFLKANLRWIAAKGSSGVCDVLASEWPSLIRLFCFRCAVALRMPSKIIRRSDEYVLECALLKIVNGGRPNCLNVHNIHECMTFFLIEKLPNSMPLVWTLHDMWPLTGYCCYSYDCDKYLSGCKGDCPQSGCWGVMSRVPASEWRRRQRFFKKNQDRIMFVAPSRWLGNAARMRFGSDVRVECVPNGVDVATFKPVFPRSKVRETLGWPKDSPVILAGAKLNADQRKGAEFLIEAVAALRERGVDSFSVVVFGDQPDEDVPEGFISLGAVSDEAYLNLCYNAADVFVLPSLADNLPNMLVESVAAGTPCVTFDVGGCSEVVRDGETGFVAKYKDVNSLADCIERVLCMADNEKDAMRATCRRVAEAEYGQDLQAARYMKLFREVVARANNVQK